MHTARPPPFPQSRNHPFGYSTSLPVPNAELKLLHTTTVKFAKGKSKDEDNWSFGWWDYVPLLEGRKPPVQWLGSSLVLTAHTTEPRVICLHFPTNKRFSLPSPHPLATTPSKYEPPSIIVASPSDDWIFACFPGIDIDSVGCWWRKTGLLNNWILQEWQAFSRGDGVVAARWLHLNREWVSNEGHGCVRLPVLGPALPLMNPALVIVTEARLGIIFYVDVQNNSLKSTSASLSRRSASGEGHSAQRERVDGPQGQGRCVRAAIGLGYDESSILIATHSIYVPSNSTSPRSSIVPVPLAVALLPSAQLPERSDWDAWRDENSVELCEISLTLAQEDILRFSATPITRIPNFLMSNQTLSDLVFVPTMPSSPTPSTPSQTHRLTTPQSSPAATGNSQTSVSPGRTLHRAHVKGSPQRGIFEKLKGRTPVPICLLVTVIDLGHYTEPPKSKVLSYWIVRKQQENVPWACLRNFNTLNVPGVIMHLSASQASQHTNVSHTYSTGALMGILHTKARVVKRIGDKSSQRLVVGKIQMLRIQEMQIDESWESVDMMCSVSSNGVQLPISLAVSPNKVLICGVSTTGPVASVDSISIMGHPYKTLHLSNENGRPKRQFATSLELALQNRIMPDDIVHCIVTQGTSNQSIEETIEKLLFSLERDDGRMRLRIREIIGIVMEIYRVKSIKARDEDSKNDCLARSLVGREICSLAASNLLWGDIGSGRLNQQTTLWNFASLCEFFIEFLEGLMTGLVVFSSGIMSVDISEKVGAAPDVGKLENEDGNPGTDGLPSGQFPHQNLSPSLCHIVHPYALDNIHSFLGHMMQFVSFLDSSKELMKSDELARDMLHDAIEASGINLQALNRTIFDIKEDIKKNFELSPELFHKCLAALKPPAQLTGLIRQCAEKLLREHVVEKSRLFIRPDEFVDGTLGLPECADELPYNNNDKLVSARDIVTKSYLVPEQWPIATCTRCGGRSRAVVNKDLWHGNAYGRTEITVLYFLPWSAWERLWDTGCLCGGMWMKAS